MSLKMVHVLFILSATALALGFGFWGVRGGSFSADPVRFWLGAASFLLAAGLAVYLFWFLAEMKKARLS